MSLGPLKTEEPIVLTPFPNGGWSIEQYVKDMGVRSTPLGAFTNADDMLGALAQALGVDP